MHWTEWILAYGPNSSQRWASNQLTQGWSQVLVPPTILYFYIWFIKLVILRADDDGPPNIFIQMLRCIDYYWVSPPVRHSSLDWELRTENIKSVLISRSTNTLDGQSCKLRPDTAQSCWGVLNGIWLEQPAMECRSPLLTKIRENKGKGKNLSGD